MRRRRNLRVLAVPSVVIAAALVLLTPSVAFAHHLPTWGALWLTDSSIVIQVTQGFPGGDYVNRLDSARNEWNAVGTTHTITRDANRIADFDSMAQCSPNGGTITIHWRDTATVGFPNALAVTGYCVWSNNTNDRHSSDIIFDTDRDWYTGTGDANDGFLNLCIGGCQTDFWSVASHEQGHAMGFDHFNGSDSVCGDNSGHHTMCPTYYGGTERDRTYEAHEEETFNTTY